MDLFKRMEDDAKANPMPETPKPEVAPQPPAGRSENTSVAPLGETTEDTNQLQSALVEPVTRPGMDEGRAGAGQRNAGECPGGAEGKESRGGVGVGWTVGGLGARWRG